MKEYETLELEKIRFAVAKRVSLSFLENLEIEHYTDFITDSFTNILKWWVWGKQVTENEYVESNIEIKYPETWWDAFKERWLPNFLLKRYPVKYIEFDTPRIIIHKTYHVCPHINQKFPSASHISFLTGREYNDK